MIKWFYLIFILLSVWVPAYAQSLNPFTTDGCSVFPDGTWEDRKLFLNCCTLHDFAYWQGGTVDQRLNADYQFSQCISNIGQPELAQLMLIGVRVGGSPYWPTPFRWGYGWPYPKGYGKLNANELQQIKLLTPAIFKVYLSPVIN
jgi:hypothetical protein